MVGPSPAHRPSRPASASPLFNTMMISTVADDEKHLDAVADDHPEQVVGVACVHQGGGGQVRLIPHLEHNVEHVRHDHTKDMTFYIDRERVIFEERSMNDDDDD